MDVSEGEILKNKFTEDLYIVKKIEHGRVILENGNGSVWMALLEKDLENYYEKIEGRQNSMSIGEGDVFKHRLTGQLYRVKAIKNGAFILESIEPPHRMWFGEGDVELFFEVVEKRESSLN